MTTALSPDVPVMYQPILTTDGVVMGVEALAKNASDLKHLTSRELEDHDRRLKLQAFRQVRQWQAIMPGLTVEFNELPSRLHRPSAARDILGLIKQSGIDPGLVIMEVVESEPFHYRDPQVRRNLAELARHDVKLAMDDLGSGWNRWYWAVRRMLRWMIRRRHELPLSTLKLDRMLIERIGTPAGANAVREYVELARRYGLVVVAEGVETDDQLMEVIRLGCHLVQGWVLSKKLSAADCEAFLLQQQWMGYPRDHRFSSK